MLSSFMLGYFIKLNDCMKGGFYLRRHGNALRGIFIELEGHVQPAYLYNRPSVIVLDKEL